MFQNTFQIVPNSSNYATNPGNVHKGYKKLGNVPLYVWITPNSSYFASNTRNVYKGYKIDRKCSLHLTKC
jgi:hypothetical protein